MPAMTYSACICCYQACNFDEIFVLCKGGGTCICCEQMFCCAANADQFAIGLIKQDGFICKVGLPCCTCGLKMPDAKDLISSEVSCLCMKSLAQFPFGDKISAPVCAVCCVQLLPGVGIMQPPPGGAPPATEMER